jgi:hypothetical protein
MRPEGETMPLSFQNPPLTSKSRASLAAIFHD